MEHDELLERYLDLCERVFERMQREGSWPWREDGDSPNAEDLVDLEGIDNDV